MSAAGGGSFAGRQLYAQSGWEVLKLMLLLTPIVMFGNKMLQGNIWGVPNRREGIVPLDQVIGKPTEKYVDTYIRQQMDTSGFADENDGGRRR